MAIKKYKPTSNSCRNMTGSDLAKVTASTPEKPLLQSLKNHAGRDNNGHVTMRHQDGRHRRQYRIIDFKRNEDNVATVIQTAEHDPNRSASIALVHYEDGMKAYILTPKKLEAGMKLVSGSETDIKVGNALPLENTPVGIAIHNVEMKPGKGGQLIRPASTSVQVLDKEGKYVLTRLNPGEVRMILTTCCTAVGSVDNEQRKLVSIGGAGCSHWMRRCPIVRSSIVNPNDHLHGGGKGKTPIGHKAPVSPWDQPALGCKTHSKKAKSDKLIVRRCKNK